jgi:hypothetical protein
MRRSVLVGTFRAHQIAIVDVRGAAVITTTDVLGLLIATFGGTAVGVERQRTGHADGAEARFAGVRTFTLLGGLGGLAGLLWNAGVTLPAAALVAGAVAITTAAYVARMRSDVDGTTEVAALVVVTAGVVAGVGGHQVALAVIAVTCVLLVEKSRGSTTSAFAPPCALRRWRSSSFLSCQKARTARLAGSGRASSGPWCFSFRD